MSNEANKDDLRLIKEAFAVNDAVKEAGMEFIVSDSWYIVRGRYGSIEFSTLGEVQAFLRGVMVGGKEF